MHYIEYFVIGLFYLKEPTSSHDSMVPIIHKEFQASHLDVVLVLDKMLFEFIVLSPSVHIPAVHNGSCDRLPSALFVCQCNIHAS